ncbi:GTP-binding protein [Cristinia sonorae]|uniref:ADP-ribosylation factor-like protein 2 n=1 Tax=Cristinia sonorae TaxID=1940300 RepID=A0A8K0XTW3_9AGAR|nr:GTP-binding protein [Cristinia sonorae]
MGLFTIIRKNRRKEREMRLLFLGLDNAGKTTILKKLNGEDITSISPTLGFNIKTFEHGRHTLNIWDIGGQQTLRPYWRNYFEQTDAIIWVVDASDRLRIEDCKAELQQLLSEDRLSGATLLVFANKQDIGNAMTGTDILKALELESIRSHDWKIQPCSAVTGEHVLDGIDWTVNNVATRLYSNS